MKRTYILLSKTLNVAFALGAMVIVAMVGVPFKGIAQAPNQTVNNGAATAPVTFPATGCLYHWVNNTPGIGLAASGAGQIASFTAVNRGNSPVTATIEATPIPLTGLAYIANGSSNTVSVINPASNTVIATIPVGNGPGGVIASPDGTRIYLTYAADESASNLSVINTANNTVSATIHLPAAVDYSGVVVSPDGSRLYATEPFTGSVVVINTVTDTVVTTIPAVVSVTAGVAISPDGSRVYVADGHDGVIAVINTATNTVISTINPGKGSYSMSVSPDGSLLYVANYNLEAVLVINAATNVVLSTIPVHSHPVRISVSPDGNRLYVVSDGSTVNAPGTVSVINTVNKTVIATIVVGSDPNGVSISPDGTRVYVTNSNSNTVSVINATTNTVSATIPTGLEPLSIGNFVLSSMTACSGTPLTFTVTVNPSPPTIMASKAAGVISACVGMASPSPSIQYFKLAGIGLSGNITAIAPANFQLSLNGAIGYADSLTLNQTGGLVDTTLIYVRSTATAPQGNISGNVVLASTGAASQNVPVAGTIKPLLTMNPVEDQTVADGAATTPVNFSGTGNAFTWVNDTPGIGLAASGTGNIVSFTAKNAGASPIKATITATPVIAPLGYIANLSAGTVSVINTINNTVVATVPVGVSPTGVAISPDGSRVYITNGSSSTVSVINTAKNKVIATIPSGKYPYGVSVSPDGSRLYVANKFSETVSVINTVTNSVIATISLPGAPVGLSVSPDGSRVYVTNASLNNVSVINTASDAVIAAIGVGNAPMGVSVSPDGGRLYVTNTNSNTVSVISTATNAVIATIPTGKYPLAISISPDGSRLYVANESSATVSVISTATNSIITTISLNGAVPVGVSVSPDGSTVYTANQGDDTVSVIDAISNALTGVIPVGLSPSSFGNFIGPSTGCGGPPVTFTITVKPPNPTLASMQPSAGHLSPGFIPATNNYADTVNYTNIAISVTPVAANPLYTITVNGITVASGSPSQAIPLAEGPNTITTVVSAGDGVATTTYTLTVFRRYSSDANLSFMQPTAGFMAPIFTPVITSYNDTVNYTNLAMEITPVAQDSLATITVNGVAVVSGAMSQAISLSQGLNTITTVVTAPDKVTTKTFTLTVFRAFSADANLSQMQPNAGTMSPVFTPVISNYADAVNYINATIRLNTVVQDSLATLTINGVAAVSGLPSQAIPLAVGSNTINTVVTAPDGITTKTYTLTVNRAEPIPGPLNAAYQPVGVTVKGSSPLLADDGLVVHQGISPNGDGVNDFLVIENIANYPDNNLSIMNRDGQLIYEAKGYDNSSKVFDGHSSKTGKMQLPGTYFYALDYTVKGVLKHKTGFIVLRY